MTVSGPNSAHSSSHSVSSRSAPSHSPSSNSSSFGSNHSGASHTNRATGLDRYRASPQPILRGLTPVQHGEAARAADATAKASKATQSMPGHYYKPYNQISDVKCNLSDSERRYLAQHFSTPFNAGAAAVNGRVTLYGSNPIGQRITNNGFTVVNQTLPGHQLHSDAGGGSVTRTVLIGENGALYTSTIGQRTNYSHVMAGVNQLAGPMIFASLDSAMADDVKRSGICN